MRSMTGVAYLEHHGVKGMKWGVHNEEKDSEDEGRNFVESMFEDALADVDLDDLGDFDVDGAKDTLADILNMFGDVLKD